MFGFLTDAGNYVLSGIVQMFAGTLLAIPVYKLVCARITKRRTSLAGDILLMMAVSLTGVLLPLGTYGIVPLLFAAVAAGLSFYTAAPILVSNMLFNMLVPFTERGFSFESNIGRIVLAFTAGTCAGLLLRAAKIDRTAVLRNNILKEPAEKPAGLTGLLRAAGANINAAGPYLILGALAATAFYRYLFNDIMSIVYSSHLGSAASGALLGRNATLNPFYLLAVTVLNLLTDLSKWSALSMILKLRGVAGYFAYCAILGVILVIPVFF